jgi:diguanylate cyclase (GGDEF)-like protein
MSEFRTPLADIGQVLLASKTVGIFGLDREGCIRLTGCGADTLFGYPEGAIIGTSVERLLPGFNIDDLHRSRRIVEAGRWTPEWLVDGQRGEGLRYNGSRFAVQISAASFVSRGDVCYVLVLIDLTAQLEHGDRLTRLAYSDMVTDLPNRAHLMRRLREANARAHEHGSGLALLFVDIDRFKEINDTIGHSGGDRALQILARRLSSAVRPQDIVARHGGDEFVVVMEDLDTPAAADRVAERILEALRKPVRLADRGFQLSVSIGIAVQTGAGETPEVLLESADAAMYRAKVSGGDTFLHAAMPEPPAAQSGG